MGYSYVWHPHGSSESDLQEQNQKILYQFFMQPAFAAAYLHWKKWEREEKFENKSCWA